MFLTATTLPLLVAVTELGVQDKHMLSQNAAALVGAGMVSVAVGPLVGIRLLRPRPPGSLSGRLRLPPGRRPRAVQCRNTSAIRSLRMADLFDDYRLGAAWDEMIAANGPPRASYQALYESIQSSGTQELRAGVDSLARAYLNQGVTFDVGGEERPFPLDIVPRVIDDASWQTIDSGVRQRVKALEAFLADVYSGHCRAVHDGVLPNKVITSSKHFHREAYGIEPPNGVRVHVSGIDLIRDEQGDFRVLEDNVRVPSGVSYVLANRSAMRQQWTDVLGKVRLRPVSHYPQRLLARVARGGAERRHRPVRRRADPGRLQQRLLRARLAGPGDGRRTRRGT